MLCCEAESLIILNIIMKLKSEHFGRNFFFIWTLGHSQPILIKMSQKYKFQSFSEHLSDI